MTKSKKTKIHKKIDGQLLQMNKTFSNLKMKQKDKITGWVFEEYKKYVTEHDKVPDLLADESHNIVYTFHNEKQNKDVYMVALRDEGKLIGYYEKHEYRNVETMKQYDLW